MKDNKQNDREIAIKKLYLLQVVYPIRRLIKRLYYKDNSDELKKLYYKTFKKNPRNVIQTLEYLNREQLITLIRDSSIPTKEIEQLFEEYKYGIRISLYLFSYAGKLSEKKFAQILQSFNTEEVVKSVQNLPPNSTIKELVNDLSVEEQPEIKSLLFDVSNVESIANNFTEVPFVYEKKYLYLESHTRNLARVYELVPGFLWINESLKITAICAKNKLVMEMVKNTIEKAFGLRLVSPVLVQNIADEILNRELLESASWLSLYADDELPKRIRAADEQLSQKKLIKKLNHGKYERVSSLYSQTISDNKKIRVGISQWEGKIYITRTLRTSEIRELVPGLLVKIFNTIKRKEQGKVEEFIEALKAKGFNKAIALKGYNAVEKELLLNIIAPLEFLRKTHQKIIQTALNIGDIRDKLSGFFIESEFIEIYCSNCEAPSFPVCSKCGYNDFVLNLRNNELICKSCNNKNNVECLYGHKFTITNLKDSVILLPNWKFIELLKNVSLELDFPSWDENNYFYLQGTQIKLFIIPKDLKVQYAIDDFEEFHLLKSVKISNTERAKLVNELKKIKERCRTGVRATECKICVENNKPELCIPKLFTYLRRKQGKIAEYIVTPHGGHEFGDVRFELTIEGNKKVFIAHAKRYPNKEIRELPATHRMGEEIIRQVVYSLKDNSVDFIGVITPLPLQFEFRSILMWLVGIAEKRIIFIDGDELLKLLKISKHSRGNNE